MTTTTQTLIEQRPYLKDPLEFYNKWQRFHHEVKEMLQKKGKDLSPVDTQAYPKENAGSILQLFASIFDIPVEELDPIRNALEAGDIDFMRFPLDEYPDLSLPFETEQQEAIMFLLSRPYFLALHGICLLENNKWENGRCPLCSAQTALASITEGPQRVLHCSYCGTIGPYKYLGCPNCGSDDSSKLNMLVPEDEPGYRLSTCDECMSYVKIIDQSVLMELDADQADLASLPLDIVAQERGYKRNVPNPIGLRKIE